MVAKIHIIAIAIAAVFIVGILAHCNMAAYKQGFDPLSNRVFTPVNK
jgi:hypothetical protein